MIDEVLAVPIPALRHLSLDELLAAIERGHARIHLGFVVPLISGGSIVVSDLVFYNAANMPTDSVSTVGGAIDTLRRPDFTQMNAGNEKIRFVSTSAGDTTQTMTITGRLADGSLASETLSMNGTSNVDTANTYERLLKAELSATCAGTVTVKGAVSGTTWRAIPIGERGFQAMFQQLASSPSGITNWYEKIFVKNTNGTLALVSATVSINADPQSVFAFGLAAALDGSTTTTNRTTAPAGIAFATTAANVANSGSLSSGSGQGIWMKLILASGNAALKSTVTMELDGNTT